MRVIFSAIGEDYPIPKSKSTKLLTNVWTAHRRAGEELRSKLHNSVHLSRKAHDIILVMICASFAWLFKSTLCFLFCNLGPLTTTEQLHRQTKSDEQRLAGYEIKHQPRRKDQVISDIVWKTQRAQFEHQFRWTNQQPNMKQETWKCESKSNEPTCCRCPLEWNVNMKLSEGRSLKTNETYQQSTIL